MNSNDHKPLGPLGGGSVPPERTPAELRRFRLRVAEGYYDRPSVAETVARRLLARGDLDPPPGAAVPGAGS